MLDLGFLEVVLICGFLLAVAVLLSISYLMLSIANKETGRMSVPGKLLSWSITVITIFMFVYVAVYGGDVMKRWGRVARSVYRRAACRPSETYKPKTIIVVPKGVIVKPIQVRPFPVKPCPKPAIRPGIKVKESPSIAPIPEFKKRHVKQMMKDPQMRMLMEEYLKSKKF